MPEKGAAGYVIGYLWEVGPTQPAGMGPAPVTHQEIAAWQALTAVPLTPLEARWVRLLSREYVAELHRAEKIDCVAPWNPAGAGPDFSATARRMKEALRADATM